LSADLERRARAAGAMCGAGQFAAAELSLSCLFADCETTASPDHPDTLAVLDLLGSTQFRRERLPESARSHREARRRAVSALGPDHPKTLQYGYNLGCALSLLRAWDEGLSVLRDVLSRRTRKLGKKHPDTIHTAKTLGVAQYMTGDKQAAAVTLRAAYQAALKAFGAADPLTEEVARTWRSCCATSDRPSSNQFDGPRLGRKFHVPRGLAVGEWLPDPLGSHSPISRRQKGSMAIPGLRRRPADDHCRRRVQDVVDLPPTGFVPSWRTHRANRFDADCSRGEGTDVQLTAPGSEVPGEPAARPARRPGRGAGAGAPRPHAAASTFTLGARRTDAAGRALQLHGLGIVQVGTTWYGFGEDKTGQTTANTAFQDIPCYTSTDLANWTHQGIALAKQAGRGSRPLKSPRSSRMSRGRPPRTDDPGAAGGARVGRCRSTARTESGSGSCGPDAPTTVPRTHGRR
jgi:hypothetical protein